MMREWPINGETFWGCPSLPGLNCEGVWGPRPLPTRNRGRGRAAKRRRWACDRVATVSRSGQPRLACVDSWPCRAPSGWQGDCFALNPQIHSLRSPRSLHLGPREPHIPIQRSPKLLTEIPISTVRINAKCLSSNEFSSCQLFKCSSVLSQSLKAAPARQGEFIVN